MCKVKRNTGLECFGISDYSNIRNREKDCRCDAEKRERENRVSEAVQARDRGELVTQRNWKFKNPILRMLESLKCKYTI